MKSSLWIVIVLVTGIVGFLVGYSVSSSTGVAHAGTAKAAKPAATAPGYGGGEAAPGYGAPAAKKEVSAGGYR
jgi:hypothetical protein